MYAIRSYYVAPRIRFLAIRPLSVSVTPNASSRARDDAVAWAVGHTPQILWVIWLASLGSRPTRICSNPRYMPPDMRASTTTPFWTSTSALRWPSILVIGSMLILSFLVLPTDAVAGLLPDIDIPFCVNLFLLGVGEKINPNRYSTALNYAGS